MDVESMFNISK